MSSETSHIVLTNPTLITALAVAYNPNTAPQHADWFQKYSAASYPSALALARSHACLCLHLSAANKGQLAHLRASFPLPILRSQQIVTSIGLARQILPPRTAFHLKKAQASSKNTTERKKCLSICFTRISSRSVNLHLNPTPLLRSTCTASPRGLPPTAHVCAMMRTRQVTNLRAQPYVLKPM
jgi:hypothetical protein